MYTYFALLRPWLYTPLALRVMMPAAALSTKLTMDQNYHWYHTDMDLLELVKTQITMVHFVCMEPGAKPWDREHWPDDPASPNLVSWAKNEWLAHRRQMLLDLRLAADT